MSDRIIGNRAAAEYVRVAVSTWRAYVARGQAPEPFDRVVDRGHALPVWRRKALDDWMKARPGKGGRPPKPTA